MAKEKGNHPLFNWGDVQVGGVITLNYGENMEVLEISNGYITMRGEDGFVKAVHKNNSYFWNARYVG